ncbi:NADPH-dependent ferric siderophore reductase [Microbacterium sp. SORGH_AS428]|uniref:siderophore-interacting protein n=1 Tax=Microbacterium sp. SORGH_AS_0428 TaxID=3041788 RepID=UPI002859B9AA|nr:siderophore-interacting protein [Microbacterium sp. SORGH_AS_0428]MDR6198336.1 NADPH-dependent ferric siderophore reductase [Microbacterium sp. SORGH_AS_0428]
MTALATRPSYRPYIAHVSRTARLSPHFVRVTFSCPEFEHFGTAGRDQRLKVLFPGPDGRVCDVGQRDEEAIARGDWYTRWRELSPTQRTPFRTYTVRRVDPASREVDIDFVLHHDPGPAGAWAQAAAAGDEIVIVGPDQRSPDSHLGIDWHPGSARRLLLAGDETAAPAIAGILESLTGDTDVDAFIEIPSRHDALPIATHARVTWLARDERAHGEALSAAVTSWTETAGEVLARAAAPRPQELEDVDIDREILWDSPGDSEGEFYAWIAGESQTVKTLRRLLVQGKGVDRKRVAFMGYWRRGVSERVE